jgi:hypothetical protein
MGERDARIVVADDASVTTTPSLSPQPPMWTWTGTGTPWCADTPLSGDVSLLYLPSAFDPVLMPPCDGDLCTEDTKHVVMGVLELLTEDGTVHMDPACGDAPTQTREAVYTIMAHYKTFVCANALPHDESRCYGVHDGKHVRRNPFEIEYDGKACSTLRKKGRCVHDKDCRNAHGVLEVGLHPTRYRTEMCRLENCNRAPCFFAHSAAELRSGVGSENRLAPDDECVAVMHEVRHA